MKKIFLIILCLSLMVPYKAVVAAEEPANTTTTTTSQEIDSKGLMCPNVNVFGDVMFTKVCWSCMLPISWGGSALLSGEVDAPSGANEDPFCYCSGDTAVSDFGVVGLAIGMWQPTRILEVVRKPFCYPSLWGADMSEKITKKESLRLGGKGVSGEGSSNGIAYYETHMYAYPLLNILQMMDAPRCTVDYHSSFDLLYMSEVFPHWSSDVMAFVVNPEAALFANPVASMASIPDCVKATVGDGGSYDNIFWEMGCWGSTYPLTGSNGVSASEVEISSLLSARFLFLLGRMGFLKRTVGEDVMCRGKYMPIMQKSQYKMQQLWPVAEADNPKNRIKKKNDDGEGGTVAAECDENNGLDCLDLGKLPDKCCHFIGSSTYVWGEHRSKAGTGEDFIYLIWQWTDCCVGLIGV